ncbi:MAG: hypothetical protein K6G62_03070 [Eubacterium sp.]|nr:hypothetical protein [Eubacterium sp.]
MLKKLNLNEQAFLLHLGFFRTQLVLKELFVIIQVKVHSFGHKGQSFLNIFLFLF